MPYGDMWEPFGGIRSPDEDDTEIQAYRRAILGGLQPDQPRQPGQGFQLGSGPYVPNPSGEILPGVPYPPPGGLAPVPALTKNMEGKGAVTEGPSGVAPAASAVPAVGGDLPSAGAFAGTLSGAPSPAAPSPAVTPTAPSGLGPFASMLEGFDAGKLAEGRDTPKYQVGRVLSRYDPSGGITPELLAELNALGIGQFSTSGRDRLIVANGDPRFEGISEFDIIRGAGAGGLGWQWNPVTGQAEPAGGRHAGGGGVGGFMSSLQTAADPIAAIQAEINRIARDRTLGLMQGQGR